MRHYGVTSGKHSELLPALRRTGHIQATHLDGVHVVGLEVRQRVITAPVVGISGADALSGGRQRQEECSEVMYLTRRQR